MKYSCILFCLSLLLPLITSAQYLETFDVNNKGVLNGPCTTTDGTSCASVDFTGVDWTVTGNLTSVEPGGHTFDSNDNFKTFGGVLTTTSGDLDVEVCWLSPVLDISTPGTVSFTLDISYEGFESSDYLDVLYSLDAGAFVLTQPMLAGSDPSHTVTGSGSTNGSHTGVGASGLTGSTLQIKMCTDFNAGTEDFTLDNVNVPQSGVVIASACPTAICMDATVQLDGNGNVAINTNDVDGGSTISCPASTLSVTPNTFNCGNVGTNTVTLTAMEGGNSSTCSANVIVEDNNLPIAICQNATVQLDGNGNGTLNAAQIDAGSNAACGLAGISVNPSGFNCSHVGSNTVTLTITDNMGNQNVCTALASVEDSVLPSITCPADITQSVDGNCQATVPDLTIAVGTILASSSPDFSGAQGQDNWFYGMHAAFNTAGFTQLSNYTGFVWNNPGTILDFPQLDANGGHPQIENQFWAVRRWQSDYTGQVQISGDFFDRDGACGDGAHVRIFQNGTEVFQFLNIPLSSTPYSFNLNIAAGDFIDFVIDPIFDSGCDDTHFTGNITTLAGPTVSDNCNNVTISQNPAAGTLVTVGVNPIVLTASDGNGNVSMCTVNLLVVDNIPPIAICNDITVALDANGVALISQAQLGSASDNCSGTGVSSSPAFVDCSNLGQVTSSIFISDNAGNTASCNGTVTVVDNIAPSITCPADLTIEWGDPEDPSATGNATATDNCSNPAITFTDNVIITGSCPIARIIERTWTATDNSGNQSSCLQIINVTDLTPPVITCPPDITIEWGDPEDPSATGTPTVTDNCDPNPTITFTDNVITTGSCPIVRIIERTWTATDLCGNQSSCLQIINVTDTTPPTITCPPSLTFEWPAGFNLNPVPPNTPQDLSVDPSITGNPITNDNCGVASVSYQDVLIGPNPSNCPFLWRLDRTWTVTDFCGLTATCVQILNFTDMTPPTIICPPDLTFEWPPGFNLNPVPPNTPQDPSIDPGITGIPITNDNCGVAGVTYQDVLVFLNACPNPWQVERTWTVTDFCGLTATCVQLITFTDTTPPTIICPPPLTFEWPPGFNLNPVPLNVPQDPSIDPGITGNPITDDNCGIGAVTFQDVLLGPTPGNCPNLWTVERTWTVLDFCGLSAVCVQVFTFTDLTPPTIICPPDLTFEWPPGFNLNPVPPNTPQDPSVDPAITGNPITDDNCGVASVSYQDILIGPDPNNCPFLWVLERTWTVIDFCNLTATCVQTLTFTDLTPPTIICPPDLTFEWPPNFNLSPVPPNVPQDPSIAPGITGNPITNDNCGVANVSYQDILIGPDPVNCPFLWTVIRTWIVTDFCSLTATCVQVFTFTDTTPPTAVCQPFTVIIQANEMGAVTVDDIDNGSSDNCGLANRNLSGMTNFDCDDIGMNFNVTLIVTDNCNLTSSCVATVSVEDPNINCCEAPLAVCNNLTLQLDANGEATADPSLVGAGSFADCGLASETVNPSDFDCMDIGPNTVTYTITDVRGQSSSCTAIMTVEDNIAPTAGCQNTTIQLDMNGNGGQTAAAVESGSSDNCGTINTVSLNPDIFGCSDVGNNNVTLTVNDGNGNTSTCSAIVTVQDMVPPMAMCQDATVQLDASGNAILLGTSVDNGSTDACGIASVSVSPAFFSCSDLGGNTVTLEVTDNNGNSSTCTATATVEDNIRPSISCPADAVFSTDPGECEATFTVPTPTASDNCAVTVLRYRWRVVDENGNNVPGEGWSSWSTAVMQTLDQGFWKFQWQAKDASNNQRKCSFLLDIVDNEPPNAVCHDLTVEFNGEQEIILTADDVYNDIASSDNCDIPMLLGFSPTSVTCDQLGTVVPVTVMIEDDSGNPAQCTANVTVGGLPCGFSANPDGINCVDGNQAAYDPNTDTYTITSEGCFNPNFYSNTDLHGYVGTQLCGDGEIIAQVVGVAGAGFAGVSMREDLSAGAKMLQLSIDGILLTKRKLRQSTGGIAFNHIFQTQGNIWLRLTRAGDVFTAQQSTDGVNWSTVITTTILMSNCIEVGLITENSTPTGSVTATFANVEIKTTTIPLEGPGNGGVVIQDYNQKPGVSIYPNPTKGEVFVDLGDYIGQPVSIQVFNNLGQALEVKQLDEIQFPIHRLDLSGYQNGLYFIKIYLPDQFEVTQKLMLVSER